MADSGCSPEVNDDPEDNSLPDAKRLVNGHLDETQLHRKLSLLCPDPVTTSKHLPLYLGDDDHPSRALIRDAISPSPRQDERRRAEELHDGRRLLFDLGTIETRLTIGHSRNKYDGRRHEIRPRVNRTVPVHCPFAKQTWRSAPRGTT